MEYPKNRQTYLHQLLLSYAPDNALSVFYMRRHWLYDLQHAR
jgi:hypothetical protein